MSRLSLSEPDFLLIRAADLKSVLVMLEAASSWRSSSQHARAAQCSRSAIGLLVKLSNSSMSLGDFVREFSHVEAHGFSMCGQPAPGGPACGVSALAAAGAFSALPDGNNGDNLLSIPAGGVL